ncbi:hypothetical protein [Actinoalloteichus hymeniacidonis]|uniref:Nephrocystin 3-like N-terminal domain-containing protein n=1 Tax=Actinoalloteichus hymeniacidonis TaxID=340345 RepID=A0AAC9HN37_9PSEU|nr:hypothetical protein [Actinoalloteichus hymeniacidonis]AOS62193.1 hypothetical protein TL08_06855 [Actinoalloteichus hymeniacidonis]MBB5909782.1 hypothetical protein [Actinoalloteichus hymeniacidonis]
MQRPGDRESKSQQKITQTRVRADRDVIGHQEIHQLNVTQAATLPVDRAVNSAYLEHVRVLAPVQLEGREEELATLTRFCTSESTADSYLVWRADAWSGKSALLSWFVLHPPPGVHVVSFFVTSSLPHQNNRQSFVENVLEQLYDLVDEPPLANLTDAKRETHFRRLLTAVATKFHQRGEHFTLVVDGLDEDRGVDGSADAHSIAALLPDTGVRVVVASRAVHDLPTDVPPGHPLQSATIEALSPSPRAAVVREAMTRDLKRLLGGTNSHRDLLGFITASGGGLSSRDLAELTGTSVWQVEDQLRTADGRSFTRRPGFLPVYLMAHAELLILATEMLGPQLESYRQRLHTWADSYRLRHWPSDTPSYLLHGYVQTLVATDDRSKLLTYVTDPRRQNLMLTVTGHDDAALAEIETSQRLLLNDESIGLVTLTRLAVHRTSLYLRNNWVPTRLPSTWVEVGQVDRAKSLINVISDPLEQARALTWTAAVLHRDGEQRLAGALLDKAEKLTISINQFWGIGPLVELARRALRIQDHERVERVLGAIKHARNRAAACASLALSVYNDAKGDEAEQWYRKAEKELAENDNRCDVEGLAQIAAAAAALGHSARASVLVQCVFDDLPKSLSEEYLKAKVARAFADGGLFDVACRVSTSISDYGRRERNLLDVIRNIACSNIGKSEELARSMGDAALLHARLAVVAFEAASEGDRPRADRLLAEIEELQAGAQDDEWRTFSLVGNAVSYACLGDFERSEFFVNSHLLPLGEVDGVLSVAKALVRAGDLARASRFVELAEDAARATAVDIDGRRLLRWVGLLIDFAEFDRAEKLILSFSVGEVRSAGMAALAEGLIIAGELARAEEFLELIVDPRLQQRPRRELVRVLLAQGEDGRSVRIARNAVEAMHRAQLIISIAGSIREPSLLDEAIDIADGIEVRKSCLTVLVSALKVAAQLGDRTRTAALLKRVRGYATRTDQQPNEDLDYFLFRGLPERLRTLTEIVDIIERRSRDLVSTSFTDSYPAALLRKDKGISQSVVVARELVTSHWYENVGDLVSFEPEAFHAILSELDRIGDRSSLKMSAAGSG